MFNCLFFLFLQHMLINIVLENSKICLKKSLLLLLKNLYEPCKFKRPFNTHILPMKREIFHPPCLFKLPHVYPVFREEEPISLSPFSFSNPLTIFLAWVFNFPNHKFHLAKKQFRKFLTPLHTNLALWPKIPINFRLTQAENS